MREARTGKRELCHLPPPRVTKDGESVFFSFFSYTRSLPDVAREATVAVASTLTVRTDGASAEDALHNEIPLMEEPL